MKFWNYSRADIRWEARKSKKGQDIRVGDLRLPDFKNILKSQRE